MKRKNCQISGSKNSKNSGKKLNSLSKKCGKTGFDANVPRMKIKDCSTILLVK